MTVDTRETCEHETPSIGGRLAVVGLAAGWIAGRGCAEWAGIELS